VNPHVDAHDLFTRSRCRPIPRPLYGHSPAPALEVFDLWQSVHLTSVKCLFSMAVLRGAMREGSGGRGAGGDGADRQLPVQRQLRGEAVQVDPIKPTLKAPGTKRLKLKYDEPLSNFAFNFNLRHYYAVSGSIPAIDKLAEIAKPEFKAGAYTRPLSSST